MFDPDFNITVGTSDKNREYLVKAFMKEAPSATLVTSEIVQVGEGFQGLTAGGLFRDTMNKMLRTSESLEAAQEVRISATVGSRPIEVLVSICEGQAGKAFLSTIDW